MIKINDKILTNEEVIKLLKEETGSGKMTGDVEFCLLENHESLLKRLNGNGEVFWEKKYPATWGLTNQYDRRNFTTGGTETCIYYTSVVGTPEKGLRHHTGELNKIVFHNGYLIVRPGQEDLLLFMRLNEQCKTNSCWTKLDNRGNQINKPNLAFRYKEIIPDVESGVDYGKYQDSLRAQLAAVNPDKITYTQAIVMAQGYNMKDARFRGEKAVRLFLAQKAQANPVQFMKDMQDATFETRAKVNSAFVYGLLTWDMPYIKWNKPGSPDDTRIVSVPAGKDHVDYFVFWLREVDRSGILTMLLGMIEREMLKDHNMEMPEKEPNEYDALLLKLGVSSLEEANALISSAKNKADNDVSDIVSNINKYDVEMLKKLGIDKLRLVGKAMSLQGAHLMKEDKLIAKIMGRTPVAISA